MIQNNHTLNFYRRSGTPSSVADLTVRLLPKEPSPRSGGLGGLKDLLIGLPAAPEATRIMPTLPISRASEVWMLRASWSS